HRALELAQRLPHPALPQVDSTQVQERELARLVAPGLLGLLEPADRLVELVLLHQVDADVVVGVAEVGVDLDGAEALGGGLVQTPSEAQRPAEERVRFSRRANGDRSPVELDRAVQIALHLEAIRLSPELRRPPEVL